MAWSYKCEKCGASLDSGERCTCEQGQGPNVEKRIDKTERKEPRIAQCRVCGLVWQISSEAYIPSTGYVCPACYSARKKNPLPMKLQRR